MRSILCLTALAIVVLTAAGPAQEAKKVTRAMYMVTGLHCPPCAPTVEESLKKVKGVKSVKVDYQSKNAAIEFEESAISAQEIALAMSATPHLMGKELHYGGALLLKASGLNDEAAGKKASAALSKIEGVARVEILPKQEAVAIHFTGKGTTTGTQLLNALESAGFKAAY